MTEEELEKQLEEADNEILTLRKRIKTLMATKFEARKHYDALELENKRLKDVIREAMRFLLDNSGSITDPRQLTIGELTELFTMLDVGVNESQ